MARYRLAVQGVVQGVGFRWFTRETARRLGLAGWVRNNSDGSVEILVEGSEGAMDRFVAALRKGPESAAVSRIERKVEASGESLPVPFTIMGRG